MAASDAQSAMDVEDDNVKLLDPSQQRILASAGAFAGPIDAERANLGPSAGGPPAPASEEDTRDVHVAVRVRPLLPIEKERLPDAFDIVSATQERVVVHQPSFNFRGAARVESHSFGADFVLGQRNTTRDLYAAAVRPLVALAAGGGVGTVFCYGQTGSGKTFTMSGIEDMVSDDIFADKGPDVRVYVSFFELLGSTTLDLLSDPPGKALDIKENVLGEIVVSGLAEVEAADAPALRRLVDAANALRRTECTYRNEVSSRSHGLCMIRTRNTAIPEAEDGRLFLIDLAGSERRADRLRHDDQRAEESRINNATLLTLKECMRARSMFESGGGGATVHIPYRSSRLTLLLKDAFELVSYRPTRTVVVACVTPHCLDASHTLDTIRYAAPIRATAGSGSGRQAVKRDPDDPAGWTNQQLAAWVAWANETRAPKRSLAVMSAADSAREPVMERVQAALDRRGMPEPKKGQVSHRVLCPYESGMQLARLPEAEFVRRCTASDGVSLKAAKEFYVRFWELVADARTRRRGGMKQTRQRDQARETARIGADRCKDPDASAGVFFGPRYTETKATRARRELALAKRKRLEGKAGSGSAAQAE